MKGFSRRFCGFVARKTNHKIGKGSLFAYTRQRESGGDMGEVTVVFMLISAIRSLLSGGGVDFWSVIMQVLASVFVVICILPLHEFAHGYTAMKLGDNTAKYSGRLTLNPLASVDPIGFVCILLFGFGWAKPVPVNPLNFKNPKRDMAITALMGPVSNVLAAMVGNLLRLILLLLLPGGKLSFYLNVFFSAYITINVNLAVFNMIPLPPLDGSRIVAAFLSDRAMYTYYRYQQFIQMGLFVLLFTGILSTPLAIVSDWVLDFVLWLTKLPFKLFGVL